MKLRGKLRIILCGPGLIGTTHARIVAAHECCELAAVVAPDTRNNRGFAETVKAPFYSDLKTALDADRFDGVIISSPNACHFEQAITCVEQRIPALVEKPMTDRMDTALSLVEAVEHSGVPILVGHHRTYSPLLNVARDFLKSERFGRLVALQGSALFLKPDNYFEESPWRMTQGGGPILINLIHEIGIMRELSGEISAVQALSSNDIRGFSVEDTAAIALHFSNGVLGTFLLSDCAASSKSWEMTSGENPAYPYFSGDSCYHFAGTNGSLDFPSMAAKSYQNAEARSWWKPLCEKTLEVASRDPLTAQFEHFVEVIRGGVCPRVSALDGYRNMQVVEAIRLSIDTGKKAYVNQDLKKQSKAFCV